MKLHSTVAVMALLQVAAVMNVRQDAIIGVAQVIGANSAAVTGNTLLCHVGRFAEFMAVA